MSIYKFLDYRVYLRDYIQKLPKKGRGEVGKIAQYLRIHSSLISQILSGSKDFSLEQAQDLTTYLGLNTLETDYFILLVQFSKAGTKKLRDYLKSKLEHIREQSLEIKTRIPQDHILSDHERSVFYSSWLYQAVWLYTSIDNGQTLEAITQRFDISRARASEILNFLVNVRLCLIKGDRYVMGPQQTHLARSSPFLVKHHANWRIKAMQRSEDLEAEELMFTSPISLNKKDFAILREQIVEFIKSASDRVEKSPAEELACLNLDLFWVKK